jgi:6-phosphogluconolactonase
VSLRVYEDKREIAEAATLDFVERAQAAIRASGRFAVALAGGSTPRTAYETVARDHAGSLDWSRVHVFFGDERAVPPDHEDSNYKMAKETMLDHLPIGSVHRMRGELPPEEAATEYEQDLRVFFGEPPRFDLVMLGIGGDGHTASLFPETPALEVTDRLAVANPVPRLDTTRITLTAPVINAAGAVVFLVAGEDKAEALREILEGDADPHAYPAKLIQPNGDLVWMVDRNAARLLARV